LNFTVALAFPLIVKLQLPRPEHAPVILAKLLAAIVTRVPMGNGPNWSSPAAQRLPQFVGLAPFTV
jgi:hypothetical protein